jgi:hypothetical protein
MFKLPLTKTVPGLFPGAIVVFPEMETDPSNPPFPVMPADALAEPEKEIDWARYNINICFLLLSLLLLFNIYISSLLLLAFVATSHAV